MIEYLKNNLALTSSAISLLAILIVYKTKKRQRQREREKEVNEWIKQTEATISSSSNEEQFKIEYNDEEWELLRTRIKSTRYFPNKVENVEEFEFGFALDYAKQLADYWSNEFNWKDQVDYLNKHKHYRLNINYGQSQIPLHYVRVTPSSPYDVTVPLLLLSGWPGSFYEFYESIDHLQLDSKYNFDIIIPSIPGYAYSSPLNVQHNVVDTAFIYDHLLRYLYKDDSVKYFVHGEDWGSFIGLSLVELFPQRVAGLHTTMVNEKRDFNLKRLFIQLCLQILPKQIMLTKDEVDLLPAMKFKIKDKLKSVIYSTGYLHLQGTKPDTIGFALTDSPVGLLAYILEKYSSWSFNDEQIYGHIDGGLNNFNKTDLLTIVTLYWMTNTITSSMRFYKSTLNLMFNSKANDLKSVIVNRTATPRPSVPIGVMYAQNDIIHMPKILIDTQIKSLKYYSILKSAGHFSAFHKPELFANDFIKFISKVSKQS